jgi:tetratricopeptide (TPR) repeat protein
LVKAEIAHDTGKLADALKLLIGVEEEFESKTGNDSAKDDEVLLDLKARMLDTLGAIYLEEGTLKDAEKKLERAIKIRRGISQTPANRQAIAFSLNQLAITYQTQNRWPESNLQLKEALKILEEIKRKRAKDDTLVNETLAITYFYLSQYLRRSGLLRDLKEAEKLAVRSLKLRESLKDGRIGYAHWLLYMGDSLGDLGRLLPSLGVDRMDEAERRFKEALKYRELLVKARPLNDLYADKLAGTHNNLGLFYRKRSSLRKPGKPGKPAAERKKDLVKARQHLEKAREIRKERPKTDGRSKAISTNHNNLGLVWNSLGEKDEAEKSFKKSLEIRRELFATNRDNPDLKRDLARIETNLGIFYLGPDPEKARKADAERAVKLLEGARDHWGEF